MTRKKLLARIETGIVVTVISVLVWLYAEGENVMTYNNQRVQVRFVAPPGQELAIAPQEPVPILVSIRASAGEMSWLEEQVRQGPIPLEIEPDRSTDLLAQTIVLRDALAASKIGSLGINIIETDPATRTVRVEPLVTRRLPIQASPTDVQFEDRPRFQPREVAVTLPRSLAEQTEDAAIIARMDLLNLSSYDVNTDVTANVPLEPPPLLNSPWTTLAETTAQVTFNIRKLTDTYHIPTVRVQINADPLLLQDFDIQIAQADMLLRDVRVTGPSDTIQAIRDNQARVWAELRPTRDEAEAGVDMLTPTLVVPDGVTFDPPSPIPVTIRRR